MENKEYNKLNKKTEFTAKELVLLAKEQHARQQRKQSWIKKNIAPKYKAFNSSKWLD